MAEERNPGSLEARADPGARVEQRGIRLGTVSDLIFDRGLRSLIGYEVVGVDGVRRFLPRIACGATTQASVEVVVPTAMLSAGELAFYRDEGVSLSRLENSVLDEVPDPVAVSAGDRRFQRWEIGYAPSGGGVTSTFQASAEDVGGGVAKVRVAGEADLYTAPELKAALSNAIDGGARGVLVDLSETTFIDSTTLGVLMGGVRRLRPAGGEIAIVCRDPNISKIFEITLLDRIFSIFDNADAGVRPPARRRLARQALREDDPRAGRAACDLELVGDGAHDRESHPAVGPVGPGRGAASGSKPTPLSDTSTVSAPPPTV